MERNNSYSKLQLITEKLIDNKVNYLNVTPIKYKNQVVTTWNIKELLFNKAKLSSYNYLSHLCR